MDTDKPISLIKLKYSIIQSGISGIHVKFCSH